MKKLTASTFAMAIALTSGAAFAEGTTKDMEDKFTKMDTNKDGMVSMTEFNTHGKQWFEQADANDDGMLSMEEKKASHEMKNEEHDSDKM